MAFIKDLAPAGYGTETQAAETTPAGEFGAFFPFQSGYNAQPSRFKRVLAWYAGAHAENSRIPKSMGHGEAATVVRDDFLARVNAQQEKLAAEAAGQVESALQLASFDGNAEQLPAGLWARFHMIGASIMKGLHGMSDAEFYVPEWTELQTPTLSDQVAAQNAPNIVKQA